MQKSFFGTTRPIKSDSIDPFSEKVSYVFSSTNQI
jgi:hypothetical protein